jgi:hypothetical protein
MVAINLRSIFTSPLVSEKTVSPCFESCLPIVEKTKATAVPKVFRKEKKACRQVDSELL